MKIKTYVLENLKIKWEGVTDFSELYKYMKLHLEDMGFSRTNHFISLELAKEKGMKFDQIIGKYSQGFLQNPAKI